MVTLTRLPARDAEDAYALADADALSDASAGPSSSPPRGVGTAAADDRTTLAILVPFREDGTGRAAQLERLLSRLASLFAARLSQVVVLVAEQAPDGRKFNRGQLLNAAFAHLARRGAEMVFPGTPPGERLSLHPARTLYCFHDCDMLPHRIAAPHYLRAPPRGVTPFVRVLNAGGCRYDPAGCFGGVTLYDDAAIRKTNGYPNAFWGWGGEDNAQFVRCERVGAWLERVSGVAFDDLEGVETVEEKLRLLDLAKARVSAKEKKRLLKMERRRAPAETLARDSDGISDASFDVLAEETSVIEPGSWDPPPLRGSSSADSSANARPEKKSFAGLRVARVVVRLRAGIEDDLTCETCGERKPPGAFAASQYHRAAYFIKREEGKGKPRANPEASRGGGGVEERRRGGRACHWDERGEEEEREEEDGGSGAGKERRSNQRSNCDDVRGAPPEREPARGPSPAAAAAGGGGGGGARGRTMRGRGRRGVRARGVWLAWRGTLGRSRVCVARRRTGRTRRGRRARRAGRRSGVGVSCSGTWTPARRVRGSSEKGEGPAGVDSTFIIKYFHGLQK